MKSFLEYAADRLINLPLLEMAAERKIAMRRVEGYNDTLAYHVVKFGHSQHDEQKSYWAGEIATQLNNIMKVARYTGNRILTDEHLFQILFVYPLGEYWQYEELVEQFSKEYNVEVQPTLGHYRDVETLIHTFCAMIPERRSFNRDTILGL